MRLIPNVSSHGRAKRRPDLDRANPADVQPVRVGLGHEHLVTPTRNWWLEVHHAALTVIQRPPIEDLVRIWSGRHTDPRYGRVIRDEVIRSHEGSVLESRIVARRRFDAFVHPLIQVN